MNRFFWYEHISSPWRWRWWHHFSRLCQVCRTNQQIMSPANTLNSFGECWTWYLNASVTTSFTEMDEVPLCIPLKNMEFLFISEWLEVDEVHDKLVKTRLSHPSLWVNNEVHVKRCMRRLNLKGRHEKSAMTRTNVHGVMKVRGEACAGRQELKSREEYSCGNVMR